MIKRIGGLLLFAFCFFGVSGQSVTGIGFRQKGQTIIIGYNITGAKFYQKFSTELYVSMDGGKTFDGPLKEVSGDIGSGIGAGINKTVVWEVLKERPDFGGRVVFDVRARVIEEAVPKRFYIGYKGALSAPMGLVLGLTGKTGFYASARINPGYPIAYAYQTDGQSITDYEGAGYYSFSDITNQRRFSFTAGLQFQAGRIGHIYVGGGYGLYDYLFKIDQFEYSGEYTGTAWVQHKGVSFGSFEAEAGILFDLGAWYLSAGATAPGLQFVEPAFSLGFIF